MRLEVEKDATLVVLFLAVLLLLVFPAMLLGIGHLIKMQSKGRVRSGDASIMARDPERVPDWMRRPMKKWTW